MYSYAPWDWAGPWHMWGGWWIFPLFMMLVMVGLCVFFMGRMHWRGSGHADSALRLLSERFARGEVSKEEFEEKRSLLVRRP